MKLLFVFVIYIGKSCELGGVSALIKCKANSLGLYGVFIEFLRSIPDIQGVAFPNMGYELIGKLPVDDVVIFRILRIHAFREGDVAVFRLHIFLSFLTPADKV